MGSCTSSRLERVPSPLPRRAEAEGGGADEGWQQAWSGLCPRPVDCPDRECDLARTLLFQQEEKTQQMQSSSAVTTQIDSTAVANESFSASLKGLSGAETPAEECRRSFEEAELEAMALETHSNASLSKQSSIVESASVQSFVFHKEEKSESSFRSRKPLKSASTAFVRAPETFTHAQPPSCPTTPMSQRRRLRINQSPKPAADEESRPKYREGTESPFKPGFYRPP